MSTWFDEDVACVGCGIVQTARLAHGIHASRAPEVRAQLFARTFHRIECRSCGLAFTGQRPLVYTDMERKHWLQVALANERPRWPELEVATGEIFDRAFVGSPLVEDLYQGFKVRLVFGLEELREKLVIWAGGLDDAVVECVKAQLIVSEPRLARATSIVVDAVSPEQALVLTIDGTERVDISAELVDEMHDPRLRTRFPELFGGRFVSIHRLLGHRYRRVEPRA
ncbi:MAG: CpXC domain-containing protein [Kofleriaceae bacterium]